MELVIERALAKRNHCRRSPEPRAEAEPPRTRRANGEDRRGTASGDVFVIIFPKPVGEPLALGYSAHFDLGLFVPAS
jgi:hypothetical protein